MEPQAEKKDDSVKRRGSTEGTELVINLLAGFHEICLVTAAIPLVTLSLCFVFAYVFQFDEVHETHCRVYNVIPSISAITGVSPQRYFWRISIALHIGPRIPITFMYRNYYRSLLAKLNVTPKKFKTTTFLINFVCLLNTIEIAALGGVTYISNKENYPIHEKIFITFMTTSLCHMLASIKLYEALHPTGQRNETQRKSLKWKKHFFALSIASTIGLLLFFAKHRFYCHDMAFSYFAFCEYVIAFANMLYHFTTVLDFPSQYMVFIQGPVEQLQKYTHKFKSN
ncbi:hypothetical protein ACFFRR_002385 [Megaselia abdita]